MGMEMRIYFLSLALIFSLPVFAGEVSENFSSRQNMASEQAVWNQGLGKIHPSLQAVNYKPGATAKAFSVGDGSHGAFGPTTYSQFSVNGDVSGNKIRFDLSRFPVLQVTSFYLAAGWVLEPVGNSPLIIYSQSDVRIEGEIWCHGENGGNAVGAVAGSGGSSRCGGKPGGNGGAVNQSGSDGTSVQSAVTAGQGGNFTGGAAVGGGGGGSWNTNSPVGAGPNSSVAGGQAGISTTDPEFSVIAGGAGGGGGSGTAAAAGAGGGGGGGVVIIHAVGDVSIGTSPTSVTGFIYANGGKGGDSNVAGGPGGGGGGGGVKIFSGGTVNIYNTDGVGASQANQGLGGVNSVPAGGAVGGPGRSWVASVGYNGVGTYSPSEEAPVVPNTNTVEFSTAAQAVTTKSFDLNSTLATIDSVVVTPASADFQVQLRGSADDFAGDDTGWTSDYSQVANKRFVQMKIIVTTSTPAAPTMADQVVVTYTPGQKKDFDFKSSGCGHIQTPTPPAGALFIWGCLLALPVGIQLLTVRRKRKARVPRR